MKLEEMGVHDSQDAAEGAPEGAGEEKQRVVGVLKRQLNRISELETQLQDARAAMAAAPLMASAKATSHAATEEDCNEDLEFIRRARAALEDEKTTLEKMVSDATPAAPASSDNNAETDEDASSVEGKGNKPKGVAEVAEFF